jgi:hypothetical protein
LLIRLMAGGKYAPVPLEYSIGWVTCIVADMMGAPAQQAPDHLHRMHRRGEDGMV